MVESEIRDGQQIASLLEAEIEGFEAPPFGRLTVDWQAGKSGDGVPAYVVSEGDSTLFSTVVQTERIYLEFRTLQAEVAEAADEAGLRARPKATDPPATLVFVERGADVKRVIDVLRACLPSR